MGVRSNHATSAWSHRPRGQILRTLLMTRLVYCGTGWSRAGGPSAQPLVNSPSTATPRTRKTRHMAHRSPVGDLSCMYVEESARLAAWPQRNGRLHALCRALYYTVRGNTTKLSHVKRTAERARARNGANAHQDGYRRSWRRPQTHARGRGCTLRSRAPPHCSCSDCTRLAPPRSCEGC